MVEVLEVVCDVTGVGEEAGCAGEADDDPGLLDREVDVAPAEAVLVLALFVVRVVVVLVVPWPGKSAAEQVTALSVTSGRPPSGTIFKDHAPSERTSEYGLCQGENEPAAPLKAVG